MINMKLKTPTVFVILSFVFVTLFIPHTTGCMSKVKEVNKKKELSATEKPKVPSSTAMLGKDESVYSKYARLASKGFYMEIEESQDKSIKVHQIKDLPPIYSQIIANDTSSTVPLKSYGIAENAGDNSNVTSTIAPPTEPTTTPIPLGPEDQAVRDDWRGDCLASNWKYCNQVTKITVMNVFTQIHGKETVWQHLDLDCLVEPIVCLHNGWTVNRCHILCMSKCNRDILLGWDTFVSYEGACKYVRK